MRPVLQPIFSGTAPDMLLSAQTMHENLAADLALFTDKFPFVTAGFNTSFQNEINTADNMPTDHDEVSDIAIITEDLLSICDEALAALEILDVYAEIAYPNKPNAQNRFGQRDLQISRSDHKALLLVLRRTITQLNITEVKNLFLSTAVGYTQLQIDNFATLATSIKTKLTLQKVTQSGRKIDTQTRTSVDNIVYRRMRIISTCSHVVFKDNLAKLDQYRLTDPTHTTPAVTTVIYHATDSITGNDAPNINVNTTTPPVTGVLTTGLNGNTPEQTVTGEQLGFHAEGVGYIAQDVAGEPLLEGEQNLVEIVMQAIGVHLPIHTVAEGTLADVVSNITSQNPAQAMVQTGLDGRRTLLYANGTTTVTLLIEAVGRAPQTLVIAVYEGMSEYTIVLLPL